MTFLPPQDYKKALELEGATIEALAREFPRLIHGESVFATSSIDPGWLQIIRDALEKIDALLPHDDQQGRRRFEIHQIKSKFGLLRLYWGGLPAPTGSRVVEAETYTSVRPAPGEGGTIGDSIQQIILDAEAASGRTCEMCGGPGTTEPNERGWIATRCSRHRRWTWDDWTRDRLQR